MSYSNVNPQIQEDLVTVKQFKFIVSNSKKRIKAKLQKNTCNQQKKNLAISKNSSFQQNIKKNSSNRYYQKNNIQQGQNIMIRKINNSYCKSDQEQYLSDFQSLKETLKVPIKNQDQNSFTKRQGRKNTHKHQQHSRLKTENKEENFSIQKKQHNRNKSSIFPQLSIKKCTSQNKNLEYDQQKYTHQVCRQCIDKFIYMSQSSQYLQIQNQRMIQHLQYLRKVYPLIKQNKKIIKLQNQKIKLLKGHANRSISTDYQMLIQKSLAEIKQKCRQIQKQNQKQCILWTSRHEAFTVQSKADTQIQNLVRARERLLHVKRMQNLYQKKEQHIDNKIQMYHKLEQKREYKLATNRKQHLQASKFNLQFKISQNKNYIDLIAIEKQLQLEQLQNLIYEVQGSIQFTQTQNNGIIQSRQKYQKTSKIKIKTRKVLLKQAQNWIPQEIQQFDDKNKNKKIMNIEIQTKCEFIQEKIQGQNQWNVTEYIAKNSSNLKNDNTNNNNKLKHQKLLKKLMSSNLRIKINSLASSKFIDNSQEGYQIQEF